MHTLLAAGFLSGVQTSHNLFALPLIESVNNVEEKKNLYSQYQETSRKYFVASTLLFTGAYMYLWLKKDNSSYLIPLGLSLTKLPIFFINKHAWDDEEDQKNLKAKDNNRFIQKQKKVQRLNYALDILAFVSLTCIILKRQYL